MPGSLVGAPQRMLRRSSTKGFAMHSRLHAITSSLRRETTSGILLLVAAAAALIWANSPWRGAYQGLAATEVGPSALHLDLSLSTWAADGLLAIFFFVVGVELKHEIVAGSLRRPREAAVPVLAAIGGMALPAIIFTVVVLALGDPGAATGWAIPTATDIAFALAILAVFGRGLPMPLRTFLLTLAVVDDLLAITVIAVFYTATIDVLALCLALVALAAFGALVRTRWARWWMLIPVALVAWWLTHESGVHATVAGVALGALVPARRIHGEVEPRTLRYEHAVRPLSTAIALPVFAFFAAGVSVEGNVLDVLAEPVAIAIVAGLVLGKLVGVLGVTALVTKVTPLRLPDGIGIRDLRPIALLTAIGFTVALLISELSFPDSGHTDAAKLAILVASGISAVLAASELRWDARKARGRDMNEDGVPDRPWPLIGSESAGDAR